MVKIVMKIAEPEVNPDVACFILNAGYWQYREYLNFINRNEIGMQLHLLSAGWRRSHFRLYLTAEQQAKAEDTFIHASGDCICKECGFEYRDHPIVLGCEWLHALCNGKYVKL